MVASMGHCARGLGAVKGRCLESRPRKCARSERDSDLGWKSGVRPEGLRVGMRLKF